MLIQQHGALASHHDSYYKPTFTDVRSFIFIPFGLEISMPHLSRVRQFISAETDREWDRQGCKVSKFPHIEKLYFNYLTPEDKYIFCYSMLIVDAWTYSLGWKGCFVWRHVSQEYRPFWCEIQVKKTLYFPSPCMLFFCRLQKLCQILWDKWFFILNLSWFVGAMDLLVPTLMAA